MAFGTGRTELGRVIAGRYRLVEVLGEGGMATVYRAVDRDRCRGVAVKLIKSDALEHSQLHTRFHREARAVAQLRHEGFAQLLDWGIERGTPFMVMELVSGETLDSVLRRHARLNPAVALRLAVAVCELLEVVHAAGLVHRDIKPGNIMVQQLEPVRLKLIDFGIAKRLDLAPANALGLTQPMALTVEGMVLGTPPYTSPEQLRGRGVDARCDIYAMGMLLYRMFTGTTPFRAGHPLVTASLQLTTPVPSPSDALPSISAAVEAVIMRCLQSEPSERYATAADLRVALASLAASLRGEPLRAAPDAGPLRVGAVRVGAVRVGAELDRAGAADIPLQPVWALGPVVFLAVAAIAGIASMLLMLS